MDELREEPVAENTTVNKPEIMREIYARVYRGSLFCYVLLIAGGAVFLSFKPLAGLISGGRFDSKLTVIEIVAGAVVVAAGILGLVSMLANRKKEAAKACEEVRNVHTFFYRDRIEVENGDRTSTLKLAGLAKTKELKHSLLFYFKRGNTSEIFFADKEGFTEEKAVEKLRSIPAYKLKLKRKKANNPNTQV
jgi:hypothetical protein